MKPRQITLFVLSHLLVSNSGFANTSATPESFAVQTVKMGIQACEQLNGFTPTNWFQIKQFVDVDKINEQRLKETSVYPFQEHYVFVNEKIPMLGYEEGDVILIRTTPLTNTLTANVGRYVISRYEGDLKFSWVREEKVQQMLAKAGVEKLPEPEQWSPKANNVIESTQPPLSNSVEPGGESPGDQKRPSNFKLPQETNTNPANEIQAVTPSSTEKSWWPVFIVLGIGLVFLLALVRRRKSR